MSSMDQPRRSPPLAHRPVLSESCVCCFNTDLNAFFILLKEMLGINHISKKKSTTPFLPGEMIFNILVLLPGDILYNVMRSVCREWCNVINNPDFINAHLQKSSNGLLIQQWFSPKMVNFVAINNCYDVQITKLSYVFSGHILSSYDGLVLFRHDSNHRLFCLTNLLTNQTLTLPPLFEPIQYSAFSALVYARSIRKYKVVYVFRYRHGFKCAVLTVGTDTTWRLIDTKHIPNIHCYLDMVDSTLFAGGHVYWTPGFSCFLLAFDVEAELIMLELPNPKFCIGKGGYFVVRESVLAFMIQNECFLWEVWELNRRLEWTRLYSIDINGKNGLHNEWLHPQNCSIGCSLYPLVWLKNGELVIFRFKYSSRIYFVYNIMTGEVFSFTLGKNTTNCKNSYYAHVNSLVSFKV